MIPPFFLTLLRCVFWGGLVTAVIKTGLVLPSLTNIDSTLTPRWNSMVIMGGRALILFLLALFVGVVEFLLIGGGLWLVGKVVYHSSGKSAWFFGGMLGIVGSICYGVLVLCQGLVAGSCKADLRGF